MSPHAYSGPRYVAYTRTNTHTCTQGLCWPLRWTGDRTTHATQSVYLTTLTVTMVTSNFSLFQFSFPLPSIHTSSHNPHLYSPVPFPSSPIFWFVHFFERQLSLFHLHPTHWESSDNNYAGILFNRRDIVLNAQTEGMDWQSWEKTRNQSGACGKRNDWPGANELMVVWVYGRFGTAFDFFSGMFFVYRGAIVVDRPSIKSKK